MVSGLCLEACPGGIICLQYADDTILFLDKNLQHASNLKMILSCFEQVSGMRINYSKSELIPINMEMEETVCFIQTLGCTEGAFPIKYLGLPFHFEKLCREDLQPMLDKMLVKVTGWRGKMLSYPGNFC